MAKSRERAEIRSKGDLSDLQKLWDSREEWIPGEGRWTPPEGRNYTGTILDVLIRPSQAEERYVVWTIQITEGELESKEFEDWQRIESQEGLNFVNGRLNQLNIKAPDDIDNLGAALNKACGVSIIFDVWYKNEFFNIGIKDVVEEKEGKPKYTKRDIVYMGENNLEKLAKELGINPDEYDWDELQDEIIAVLNL